MPKIRKVAKNFPKASEVLLYKGYEALATFVADLNGRPLPQFVIDAIDQIVKAAYDEGYDAAWEDYKNGPV